MTNRIFSLPSGRKVVLQSPDLDTLSELHEMKLRVMNSNPLLGLESLQTSTPRMRSWMSTQHPPGYFAETPEEFETELRGEPKEFIPGLTLDTRGVKDILSPQTHARLAVLNMILGPRVCIAGIPTPDPMPAFGRMLREIMMYSKNDLNHPAVTLGNSLDSFNRKAKKLGKKL
jgi:hypothetical protein